MDGSLAWDATTGEQLACLRAHESGNVFFGGRSSLAWTRDGGRIVSGGQDATVRIWDASTGQQLACLRGHSTVVTRVAWNLNESQIISAEYGNPDQLWFGSVRVWDATSGTCLEDIGGRPDVAAIAAGANDFPWWGMVSGVENATVIEPSHGGPAITRFPDPLGEITTHRSGRLWAGVASYRHLTLIRLEGNPQHSPEAMSPKA